MKLFTMATQNKRKAKTQASKHPSYPQMIATAIQSKADKKMQFAEICSYITKNYEALSKSKRFESTTQSQLKKKFIEEKGIYKLKLPQRESCGKSRSVKKPPSRLPKHGTAYDDHTCCFEKGMDEHRVDVQDWEAIKETTNLGVEKRKVCID